MKKFRIRRDKNALVIFNPNNGDKLRLAIGSYTKASVPELADIKITDWCDYGCSFCYQNSTLQGKHASWENLEKVANELAKEKVLEVAIGGGEPTGHPDFIKLLKLYSDLGVVPNFTTKKPAIVRKMWAEIENYVGGFAYSAETHGQIYSVSKLLKDRIPNEKMNLHYVMGLQDKENFLKYMEAAADCNYRVTLLGYKTVGRGGEADHQKYDWWIGAVNEMISRGTCPTFSIDTPLAAEYQDLLPVSRKMFHTQEGKFSVYVDNVSMKFGASSFENLEKLVPFDDYWKLLYREI